MLVLTRRVDERIMVGDDIIITLVDIDGLTVKIGIEAPRKTTIHREEIYNKIKLGKDQSDG